MSHPLPTEGAEVRRVLADLAALEAALARDEREQSLATAEEALL